MTLNRQQVHSLTLLILDAILVIVSFVIALELSTREVADIHYRWFEYLWMFTVILSIKLFVFYRTGLYKEIIRFVSMEFAVKVVKSTIFGSLVSISLIHIVNREIGMPVLVVDWMASCILIGLTRFGMRYILEGRLNKQRGKNTFLYGAGEHGAAVARHLRKNDRLGYRVVGFIDDNSDKSGKVIEGVPVVGNLNCLPRLIENLDVEDLIVTFAEIDGDSIKKLVRICREKGIRSKIVPGMADIIAESEFVRNIDIADLMRRPQRKLDREMIERFLKGRRIMITGAAGSIGSEIFRQVIGYGPEALAAIDHSEYGLYHLDEEFAKHPLKERCFFSLVDIKCDDIVDFTIKSFKPDVIFHAAAYKHVPILEQDVRQAVRNNIGGLLNVVNSAEKHGVDKFVFISTDKAVRPTSIMGTTKRIGELVMQVTNSRGNMKCASVRFGNVLASSGSVVPKFIEQIKSGGPVTVTHPEVTRYFMLIPEAVELVLQAASFGNSGELFVLDMGKPVRIKEMAEDLISLMGHIPHTGIPIVYTGLRPGEKLYEELFHEEIERPTQFKDIKICMVQTIDISNFEKDLSRLIQLTISGQSSEIKCAIKFLVPEYKK